jgi:hypothetical protein
MKKGSRGYEDVLTESILTRAQEQCYSGAEVARRLGVSYHTYKRYCKLYGLDPRIVKIDPNRPGKKWHPESGKYPAGEVAQGKHLHLRLGYYRQKLIDGGYKAEECEHCGFKEKQMNTGRVPIIMHFKDGDCMHRNVENVAFYCPNCYCLMIGNPYTRSKKEWFLF